MGAGTGDAGTETGDGVQAWLFLRCVEDCETAWRELAARHAVEPGPFPIHIQTPVVAVPTARV